MKQTANFQLLCSKDVNKSN